MDTFKKKQDVILIDHNQKLGLIKGEINYYTPISELPLIAISNSPKTKDNLNKYISKLDL